MSANLYIHLANEVKTIRENSLLSQVDFAKCLDISKSLVCRAESGERKYSREIIEEIFKRFNIGNYDKIKILLFSEYPIELINNEENCLIIVRLSVELKNNGLFGFAKKLIREALLVLEESVDFYVLLSTINLLERKYVESQENMEKAISLYKKGYKSITTEVEIYHNYANIFFNLSYDYEYQKMEIINSLRKKGVDKQDILLDNQYIEIINKITKLYDLSEEYFLIAYNIDTNDSRIICQLARLYFNLSNINNRYIDKAYDFLNKFLGMENIKITDRIELSIFLSIIMSHKGIVKPAIIILDNIICLQPNNILAYLAKAIIYSLNSDNNQLFLQKSINTIEKLLSIDNSDDTKLQITTEFNFDNIRKDQSTAKKLIELCS